MRPRKLVLAAPRGFCAGVRRAVDVIETAPRLWPLPIYVRREVVHNRHVLEDLKARGVQFVAELDEVPDGSLVIFSAHGIAPEVRTMAAARGLRVLDATCPLVTKVHLEAVRFAGQGRSVILIGHQGHDEVTGIVGEAPGHVQIVSSVKDAEEVVVANPEEVAVITQTTLSIDDTRQIMEVLKRRFPRVVTPTREDICYATQNRQMAVKILAERVDAILVLGSANSSNSLRLQEVAQAVGARAYLIEDSNAIQPEWIEGLKCLGLTAGASTPENLVEETISYFSGLDGWEIEELKVAHERMTFTLPVDPPREQLVRLTRSLAGDIGFHQLGPTLRDRQATTVDRWWL